MTKEKIYKVLKKVNFIGSATTITHKDLATVYTIQGIYTLINEEYIEEIVKNNPPKTWGELEKVSGWYVDNSSCVSVSDKLQTKVQNKNVFFSHEEAYAALALAQLSQLKHVYNDGWVPDFTDGNPKYVIYIYEDSPETGAVTRESNFLAFKTAKIRDEFLTNFRDLIIQAKPLL
jgi:hypothetical protein